MNLDKSTKRIAKKVKNGFQGYPQITLAYLGPTEDCATQVVVSFILEAGASAQEERFSGEHDVRKDETIQTTLVKIIERAEARTVVQVAGVAIIKS